MYVFVSVPYEDIQEDSLFFLSYSSKLASWSNDLILVGLVQFTQLPSGFASLPESVLLSLWEFEARNGSFLLPEESSIAISSAFTGSKASRLSRLLLVHVTV